MIRYISVLFIFSLVLSQEIINEESKNDSTLFEFIVGEEMTDLELMLIADMNRNKVLEKYLQLDIIAESLELNAPEYDRFDSKNNQGLYFPTGRATTLYFDRGIIGWSEASKWLLMNNDTYSTGFFNTSFEKFTYYNSRKGFVDTDNYFKDPWNQRDINDYIRYMHMPPTMTNVHPMEANTIYDRNRN